MKGLITTIMNKRALILASMLLSVSAIFAQSNAPNSPEAASFEPIDATDMVNLATGDFTYVLPVMNVPSPEGGYPIALSYHAGIAMDQEASWAGLGWNLNPGAINRNVNGYPDDYNHSVLSEYFYDVGGTQTIYSASLDASAGGVSIGANFSWSGNKSLGGAISIGYGPGHGLGGNISIGTNGVSGGVGYKFASGLSLGVSASSNGTVGVKGGYTNTNGSGFSIGASSNGAYSASFKASGGNSNLVSMSVSFSSSGVGISGGVRNRGSSNNVLSGGGIGLNVSFNNSVSMGDYTTRSSGFTIPVMVPIGPVVISASFGKQEIRYALGKNERNYINGPMNFHNGTLDTYTYMVECRQNIYQGANSDDSCGSYGVFTTFQEAEDVRDDLMADMDGIDSDCNCYIEQVGGTESFMDMYAIPIDNNDIGESVDLTANNLTFPSYDNYNVQAQGLSGSMSAPLFDNGALFGLSDKSFKDASDNEYTTNYLVNGGSGSLPDHTKFTQQPDFYMRNEISTYLGFADVNPANFILGSNASILQYYLGGVEQSHKPRRKTPNHIEYYTNTEIVNNPNGIKSEGYLKPNVDGMSLDRSILPQDGIGAFKITAADGKTYHYSLPVYNHETVIRTLGAIKDNNGNPKDEDESYLEKRQLESYATHWLLTAVTGPDFIDRNNDGVANEGDYGYWTSFSYGKWSDAWVWKTPVKEDYIVSADDVTVKTKVNGRKELYYLNTIKTRTHTALFVKERDQVLQNGWNYSSVLHEDGRIQNTNDFDPRFNIPQQRKLHLSKVVLLKNESLANINLFDDNQQATPVSIGYTNSSKSSINSYYDAEGNVLTESDLTSYTSLPTLKTVELTQQVSNTSGSKRELKQVNFKGKNGVDVIPPYQFNYYNSNRSFNIKDKDSWGYSKHGAELWSLNQIKTPEGGMINIDYEDHRIKTSIKHNLEFTSVPEKKYYCTNLGINSSNDHLLNNRNLIISPGNDIVLEIGNQYDIRYKELVYEWNGSTNNGSYTFYSVYNGLATVTADLGNNEYRLLFNGTVLDRTVEYRNTPNHPIRNEYSRLVNLGVDLNNFYSELTLDLKSQFRAINQGGIRASKVSITDGVNEYATTYNYGKNSDGIGYVSYLPYAPELEKEMPYSSELPAPKPMYDYVSVETKDTNGISQGSVEYHFKVLPIKEIPRIKFGDAYSIDIDQPIEMDNVINNKKVNIAKYTVQDNLASIGQLLSVASYNSKGQMLSKTENEYYAAGQTPNQLGMTKQAFQTYKEVDFEDNTTLLDKWIINSSSRITYPSLLKSTKSVSGGYTFESEFTQFNPDTGQSDEIISEDSKGNQFKSETLPAYKIYPSMGSKVDNITNKHMLTQQAMSKSFIKVGNDWKLTGSGITTWNNDWRYFNPDGSYEPTTTNPAHKIWRKHKTYVWDGNLNADGTFQNFTGDYDNFNWGLGGYVSIGNGLVEHTSSHPSSSDWKEVSHITTYNHYSMPLEVKDINGNYASTKTDKNHEKVIATSNAAYTEQFYSGAEDQANGWTGGHVGIWNYSNARAHTGQYSEVSGSKNFRCYPIPRLQSGQSSKKFKVSVWASKGNHSNARIYVEGQGLQSFNGEIIPAGEWVQLNHYFDLNTKAEVYVTSVNGTIYFDDFKLHPMASSSTSYVYNESDELTYILGTNNLATKYEYDDAGRLVRVYNEIVDNGSIEGGFKLVKEMIYSYKSDVTVSTPAAPRNPVGLRNIVGGGVNACLSEVIAPVGQTTPNMQYRWAQGASPDNLVLGSWTSDLCMELVLEPCRNTFYKVVIRNADNGVTREWSGSHFNREGCPPRDIGIGSPIIDEGRTIRGN